MSTTSSTSKSTKVCPECQEINDTEVYLKEITIKMTMSTGSEASGSGAAGSGSGGAGGTQTMEIKILQCPCCKTIYDENVTTLTESGGWREQYEATMEEYNLGGELPDYDGTGVSEEQE